MLTSAVKNIFVFAVGCVLAFGILEAGLRVFEPVNQRIRGDNIVLPANQKYVFEDVNLRGVSDSVVHTKNELGFRGPNLPEDGLASSLSMVAVGGSTTECFYLSDGMGWPMQLSDRLDDHFTSLWLNNAGLDGHSSYGHRILIRDHLASLEIDVILFLVGGNDVGHRGVGSDEAEQVKSDIQFESLATMLKSTSAYSDVVGLALNVYRAARAWVKGLPHQNVNLREVSQRSRAVSAPKRKSISVLFERHREQYLPAYRERLRRLIQETRQIGAEPVLITQPKLYGVGRDQRTGVNLETIEVQGYSGRVKWRLVERYNEVTRTVGSEKDVMVIDLAQTLPKNSAYFYDYTHFTEGGAAKVASLIEAKLVPYLRAQYPDHVRQSDTSYAPLPTPSAESP